MGNQYPICATSTQQRVGKRYLRNGSKSGQPVPRKDFRRTLRRTLKRTSAILGTGSHVRVLDSQYRSCEPEEEMRP